MAAGDSNIVEIYNAGNAPKQMSMTEDWNKMNADYKLALSTARSIRNEELSKARDTEKNAKKQYNDALKSGDQEAINKAKGDLDNAKAAKKQVYVAYDEAKNKAKAQRKLTHDSLRSAEKEHNNISADATLNFNRDLADIQKEQTEELSKQFSSSNGQSDTDNQGSDNQGSDNQGSDNQGSDNQGSDNQGSNDGGKDMSKGNNKKGLGLQFSQSFYDNISNAVKGQPTGNLADVKSKGAKEQAQNLRNATATNQMEAQRAQQIANQNPYAEASKIASMQNDAENKQNVQKAGVLGAGAALARKTNTPDVQSQIQRQDQQQSVANQRREEEQANQQEATELGNISEQWQFKSRDYTEDKNRSAALSKGEPAQPEQKPEQPEQQPEQKPEQKPEEPSMPSGEPQTPETFNANWQNVMNYLTYGNDPTSKWSQPGGKDGGAAQKYAEAMGWQPLSESDVANASNGFDSPTGELQQIMKNQRPEFMQAWEEGSGRVKDGKQINAGDEGYEQAAQTNTQDAVKDPPSDSRVKDIKKCLCDARMKWIKEDWDRDGKPSREDMMWLIKQQGPFHHNDRDYDPNDYDNWNDEDGSILGAYADNIKNYVYNYKPEATKVDPNIDPNQEHIGPMAQDIEQVNPACVKETPEGVKTVDTSRLAMMNAGAIGDLAREIQDLKARLAKLGV